MSIVKAEGLFAGQNIIARIKDLIGKRVNVEFECGNCCKRVTGGVLAEVAKDFIRLAGNINIIIFVPGFTKPVIKRASVVIIPLVRVCSIERPLIT